MYGLLCLEAKVCSSGQSVCKLSLLQYVRKVQPSQLCSQKEMTLTVALMAVGAPDPKPTLNTQPSFAYRKLTETQTA